MKSDSIWTQGPVGYWKRGRYSITTVQGPTGTVYDLRAGRRKLGQHADITAAMGAAATDERGHKKPGPKPGTGGRPCRYPKAYLLQVEVSAEVWRLIVNRSKVLGLSRADTTCEMILGFERMRQMITGGSNPEPLPQTVQPPIG